MTVADLTERELVARIQRRLAPAPDWLLVGIGDDAAVAEPPRNRVEVLTVDAIVEGIHFDRAFVPPDAIGHRALAVNLSDLAAMGAAPRLALLSMALPASLAVADFDALADGFAALAACHRLHLAGGNLARSPGPLMIDVTVVGTVKRRQALARSGARPGDDVYVSGTIGAAAAGLARLREGPTVPSRKNQVPGQEPQVVGPQVAGPDVASPDVASPEVANSDDFRLATDDLRLGTCDLERLMRAYLFPQPRVLLGVHLGRNRAASACIDLSDGLADGIHRIAEASGVGMTIDAGTLPIDPAARAFFDARGADPIAAALTAGDDYELLFTVHPRTRRRLAEAERRGGVPLTRIGQCTGGGGVLLRRGTDVTLVPEGYSHFGPTKSAR